MNRLCTGAGILLFTLLSFFQFPGHTWLQQDTQIYAPILEHLRDPSVLRNDMLVKRPHVSFTLYDETALWLRQLTALDFQQVLALEQVVTRALGIWGIWLMATACGLASGPALVVAGIYALGATINGPSVLSFEIEPDPRGFAVPLLFFAAGLTAHARYLAAGVAGSVAFLIHPPTVYPFWGVYFCLAMWPAQPDVMRRRLYGLAPLIVAAAVLAVASRRQAGEGETQVFFSLLTPLQEQLQRMRASYCWISMWWRDQVPHYVVLWIAGLLAFRRIRDRLPFDLRLFLLGMPLIGMLSMPASAVLLEKLKWALLPQFQPMRAVLFVTVMAVFVASVAGLRALERRRVAESVVWFALAYLVPVNTSVTALPDWRRAATILVLVLGALLSGWGFERKRSWAPLAATAATAGAFFLLPALGRVQTYPYLHTPQVIQLSAWARSATPKDAVFLFPDAGRNLYPGIFRSRALRAVYVDWKGGGQVNYLKALGEEWWARWQATLARPFHPSELPRYRSLGIDYVVVQPSNRIPALVPVYANSGFVVYRLS